MKDVTHSEKEDQKKNSQLKRLRLGLHAGALLILLGYYYFYLPPLNYASMAFWAFLGLGALLFFIAEAVYDSELKRTHRQKARQANLGQRLRSALSQKDRPKRKYRILFAGVGLVLLAYLAIQVIYSPLFMADRYAHMIELDKKDFKEDFPETDASQIPLIDRDTAALLGNRRLGELSELVSQFEAAPDYTQINIQGHPYRVSPLEYAGFFKWLNNFRQGIPNYIQVDMVSGDTKLVGLEQTMRYTNDDLFFRNAKRVLRLRYPFAIFNQPSFEVDDQGHPYYVATTYGKHFIVKEPEPTGVVLLDAVSGETQHYQLDQVPGWIDRVYSSDIILHQLQMNGKYRGGFWNALFAKAGVTKPTAGYNYLPMNDDIFLYTGVTSVAQDASNIGFVLVNMRTKETSFYPLTAAEEISAMKSSEGSVQEKGYQATFPLLINLKGNPMYILSLKDQAGLIKQYALIDVNNYQNVIIAQSVPALIEEYAKASGAHFEEVSQMEDLKTIEGQLDQIAAVVKEGNSVYYLKIDGSIYQVPIQLNEELPFLVPDTAVKLQVKEDGQVEKMEVVD